MICSMIPVLGTAGQALMYTVHRWWTLGLVVATIWHAYATVLAKPGTLGSLVSGYVGSVVGRPFPPPLGPGPRPGPAAPPVTLPRCAGATGCLQPVLSEQNTGGLAASGTHVTVASEAERLMDISIIIPAYREAAKIRRDVEAAAAFLVGGGLSGEILVVDDGSDDGTREAALAAEVPAAVRREVVRYEPRRGKGFAVRSGMKASQGDFAMFADAGPCVPYDNALRGLDLIRRGECEIAHGSRKLPESVIRRPQTPVPASSCPRLFRCIVRRFMGTPRQT